MSVFVSGVMRRVVDVELDVSDDWAVGSEETVSVAVLLSLLSVMEEFVAVVFVVVDASLSSSGSTGEGDCLEIGGLEFCEYESFESR